MFAIFSNAQIVAWGIDEDLFTSTIDTVVQQAVTVLGMAAIIVTATATGVVIVAPFLSNVLRRMFQFVALFVLGALWPALFTLPLLFVSLQSMVRVVIDPNSFITGSADTVAALDTAIGFGLSGIVLLFCAVFVAACFHSLGYGMLFAATLSPAVSRTVVTRLCALLALVLPLSILVKVVAMTQMLEMGFAFFVSWVACMLVSGCAGAIWAHNPSVVRAFALGPFLVSTLR